jgi:hypothetical protein
MPVPAEISQLVELFERNHDQYRAPTFTEAAVRHQFIDPLFIALGWNVNNTQGFAMEAQRPAREGRAPAADRGDGSADRRTGVRVVWADGGGDQGGGGGGCSGSLTGGSLQVIHTAQIDFLDFDPFTERGSNRSRG